eukprot:TRINITY_DN8636_c0_g1_i1.p1 TRINITY_DN8636_c0_g1~~TRINITY_DN8636_c0_g1_i1.p1  ORF type:complete len:204 (+),score=34.66 TRINITY_DN8636_c0_g1_i1:250-861(+)
MDEFDFNLLTSRPMQKVAKHTIPESISPSTSQPKPKKIKVIAERTSILPTQIRVDEEHRKSALARLGRRRDNFQSRMQKRRNSSYDKQPVTVENSRLTWTFSLQPYPRSYGGQGFAKPSHYVGLRDDQFQSKFQALWDEHLAGFHRKAFTKARKREFQREMLWKEQQSAKTAVASATAGSSSLNNKPKAPARVGKKKRRKGKM